MDDLTKLKEELLLRGFTPKTRKAYLYHVGKFLESGKSKRAFILSLSEKG